MRQLYYLQNSKKKIYEFGVISALVYIFIYFFAHFELLDKI